MLEAFVFNAVGGAIRSLLGYLRNVKGAKGAPFDIKQLIQAVVLAIVTGVPTTIAFGIDPHAGLAIGYATGSAAQKAIDFLTQ